MKKASHKSRSSSRPTNKTSIQNTDPTEQDFDDSSLDQIFRFDDKLIGKRTNTIFDVKPANDGFFDIIQQTFNSDLSFESSTGDYESSASMFENLKISQIDHKKNQKMIRLIKESQTNDLLDTSLMEIDEDDDFTQDGDSQSKESQNPKPMIQEQKPQNKSQNKLEKAFTKPSQPDKKPQNIERLSKPIKKPENFEKPEKQFKKLQKTARPLEKKIEKDQGGTVEGKVPKNQSLNNKVNYKSAREESKAQNQRLDKKSYQKAQPTAEKKSHIISGQQIPDLQKLNEAKSKARSQDNPKEPNQKVESGNQDVVKVERKFQNKNEIQERRKEQKHKVISKDSIPQQEVQKKNLKEKKETVLDSKYVDAKLKALSQKVIQSSKRRRPQKIEPRSPSPTPEYVRKNRNERRIPIDFIKRQDKQKKIPKIKVTLEIDRVAKNEEYQPFGRMGEEGRYPKRLRIPPLRFWNNERRNYDGGMLSSITLIDDQRGKEISEMIQYQVDESDEI